MYLELTWLNILITLFFIDLHITVIMSTSKYFELADWFDYSLQIYWWGTFMVISRFFLEFFFEDYCGILLRDRQLKPRLQFNITYQYILPPKTLIIRIMGSILNRQNVQIIIFWNEYEIFVVYW